MFRQLVIGAVLLLGSLQAAELPELSFDALTTGAENWLSENPKPATVDMNSAEAAIKDFASYQNREVMIRGFLHRNDDGTWSLAAQPSLRSCCLGKKDRATLQVILDRPFAERAAAKAVTLRGTFAVDPRWGDQGQLQQIYVLGGAKVVGSERRKFPLMTLSVFAIVALGAVAVVAVRKRRR